MSPAPEEVLDEVVTVGDLAAGGRGVGRLADGRAVFVSGAFPGDVVHLTRGRARGNYVEVERFRLVSASAERQAPPCPDEARCGGCDWMALSVDAQRRHKADIVRQSLQRVGRIATERLPARLPLAHGSELGYRRRVRLHVEGRRLGFFAQSSRTLVEVSHCSVCAPELWQVVTELRALLADETRTPSKVLDGLLEVEVRVLADAERPALRLRLREGKTAPRALLAELGRFATVEGDAPQRHDLAPGTYALLPPGGFVQVNAEINERLLAEVLEAAHSCQARTALDVYCGVGNFALPLARAGIQTVGLELSEEAVQHALRAASEQDLPASFRAGAAEGALRQLTEKNARFDLVVVDPPRAGAKGLAAVLARLCARTLVMISCDPVTLARDVAALEQAGLELVRTLVLDMFPQTHHIESLAVFRSRLQSPPC